MFGMRQNACVGRGGAGEASGTSSQISDILVKSNYRDVGQISSLETRDGGYAREGTRDQMWWRKCGVCAGLLVRKAEGNQLASLGHSLSREEGMSRREEVAGKKFNMTFFFKKKNLCQAESVQPLRAKDGGQAGPLRGQSGRRREGRTPGLWQLCFELCPSFCGGFVFL